MVCENRVADFFCGNLEVIQILCIFASCTYVKLKILTYEN